MSNDNTPGLGEAGRVLYEQILGELPEGLEFDARELALLERAATCADAVAALDAVVAAEGPTTIGSRGQTVIHPALAEARMQKIVMLRLLKALEIPVDEPDETPAQRRARLAALARWSRRDRAAQLRRAQ